MCNKHTRFFKLGSILFIIVCFVLLVSLACQRGIPLLAPGGATLTVISQETNPTQSSLQPQARTPFVIETRNPEVSAQKSPDVELVLTPRAPIQPNPSAHDLYFLDARLDYSLHELDVRELITYTNRTGGSLDEILLAIDASLQEGVFNLEAISWNNENISLNQINLGTWQFTLPSPMAPDDVGILTISYQLALREGGSFLSYSSRQTNFGDWYVRIPPFKAGGGWQVHEPGTAGENSVYDIADFKIQIDLGDSSKSLVVAASSPSEQCGNKLCYEMVGSRGFAWSLSEDYLVLETQEGGIRLQQYVFPEHAFAGQAALDAACQALKIFQDHFGAYPYHSLSMVEADFFDGMEYPGLFFLGEEYYENYDGSPKGYLTSLTVHETAHQWWFAVVGNDQALEPWLDEALATYSELIFYQEQYPDLADWWWDYRVNRFEPGGLVDSSIYDTAGFRPYVNAVYLRGAQFLQELRVAVGDDQFTDLLKEYFSAYQGRIATTDAFFAITEQYLSPERLARIREPYFSP